MPDSELGLTTFLLLFGGLIVLVMLVRAFALRRLRIPPVVAYIALGALLRAADAEWAIIPDSADWTLAFLGQLGFAPVATSVDSLPKISCLVPCIT